jgi:hypothetical protein
MLRMLYSDLLGQASDCPLGCDISRESLRHHCAMSTNRGYHDYAASGALLQHLLHTCLNSEKHSNELAFVSRTLHSASRKQQKLKKGAVYQPVVMTRVISTYIDVQYRGHILDAMIRESDLLDNSGSRNASIMLVMQGPRWFVEFHTIRPRVRSHLQSAL